eukprot:355590-Chlamydomonas_euryale.AAC.4
MPSALQLRACCKRAHNTTAAVVARTNASFPCCWRSRRRRRCIPARCCLGQRTTPRRKSHPDQPCRCPGCAPSPTDMCGRAPLGSRPPRSCVARPSRSDACCVSRPASPPAPMRHAWGVRPVAAAAAAARVAARPAASSAPSASPPAAMRPVSELWLTSSAAAR